MLVHDSYSKKILNVLPGNIRNNSMSTWKVLSVLHIDLYSKFVRGIRIQIHNVYEINIFESTSSRSSNPSIQTSEIN